MRAFAMVLALCCCAGCSTGIVEPGHRAVFFDPANKGVRPEVLGPGRYKLGMYGRLEDFDVTYSTHKEALRVTSADKLQIDVHLAIIYRPIVSEIYELDTEIGPNYYDEVVGPEARSAAHGVFARHVYQELDQHIEKIEDEIEADLRRRITGKHVEISSITMEAIDYAPEIAAANRARLVGEQEAARQKAAIEQEAARQKAAIEADGLKQKLTVELRAEQEKLETEAEVRKKQNEVRIAEEDAKLEKVQAAAGIIRAKAEAEQRVALARATAEEKKAEAKSLSWLEVQMHAYDALGKLGGENTHVFIGDWSKLPHFLFPPGAGMGGYPVAPTWYSPPSSPPGPTKPAVVKEAR